jgi:site-specific DNA recombinase
VLTVAYCRVSTEEQAEEGYSIEGQADKLRAYAALRDLGEVTVISDPGLSGKDLNRSGLQQLLAAVEAGHVSHVLVWRLDRLSRNLGDLIVLADTFENLGVALHSVSENLDLSSASGRMFYNILGTFAQFFREQLAENVRMGNERAVKEGRWINRPKTGYDLIGGDLVPNGDAARVREVFILRAANLSYRAIEERTGLKYSTVCWILSSRVYLGEVLHNGQWFPGRHQAMISEEEWRLAHRGLKKGVQPSRDLLSGRVRCGLCERRMAIAQNGKAPVAFKCRHRGQGCAQPARSTRGLARSRPVGVDAHRARRGPPGGHPPSVGRRAPRGARGAGAPGPPAIGGRGPGDLEPRATQTPAPLLRRRDQRRGVPRRGAAPGRSHRGGTRGGTRRGDRDTSCHRPGAAIRGGRPSAQRSRPGGHLEGR